MTLKMMATDLLLNFKILTINVSPYNGDSYNLFIAYLEWHNLISDQMIFVTWLLIAVSLIQNESPESC